MDSKTAKRSCSICTFKFWLWIAVCHDTNLVIQVKVAEAWNRLGKLSELCDGLHRHALAAVEDPHFNVLIGQSTCTANHLCHQSPLGQMQSLHVMDYKGLGYNKITKETKIYVLNVERAGLCCFPFMPVKLLLTGEG